MIKESEIQVVGKAGVGVLVTKALHMLVHTIQQCDAAAIPLTKPIQCNEIAMDEQDLANLAHKIRQCLTSGSYYVWLLAGPDKVVTTPIAELTMEDQRSAHGIKTICVLDPQDARFQVGPWGFQAIQNLVNTGTLLAQAISNRTTWRNGWIVISSDRNNTLQQQYGRQRNVALRWTRCSCKTSRRYDGNHVLSVCRPLSQMPQTRLRCGNR
jgi:hypothetical protein